MESDHSLERAAYAALERAQVEVVRFHCIAELRGFAQSFLDGERGAVADEEMNALRGLVSEYSNKLVNEGAYIASALTELGFDLVAAHRFLAGDAESWADIGRRIDGETAAMMELMARAHYRIAYQRMQQGGHPLIADMQKFKRAAAGSRRLNRRPFEFHGRPGP